jgi:hypothetical protein
MQSFKEDNELESHATALNSQNSLYANVALTCNNSHNFNALK